jgi:pre-mRNA-splicing factor SYF1
MRHAVSNKQPKQNLVNNIRAWSLYIDLLQSCDELDDAGRAFDHVIERKIATPLMILNYASMLQQRNKFEESFKVFERATTMFPWPNSYEIWLTYISTFIQVVGGTKVERVRHLFEECLKDCPSEKSRIFLLMFADYEENFGLLSHAMDIYERATNITTENLELWNIYLAKVM